MAASEGSPSASELKASADWIREHWDRLEGSPERSQRYSELIAHAVPYTASIHPQVLSLSPGQATVEMPDLPELRNHLGSLHAIALCNLAELTANLALAYALPEKSRFIVTQLQIEYLKKAHGPIRAHCQCPVPESNDRQELPLKVTLKDSEGDSVASATVNSLVGPAKL